MNTLPDTDAIITANGTIVLADTVSKSAAQIFSGVDTTTPQFKNLFDYFKTQLSKMKNAVEVLEKASENMT